MQTAIKQRAETIYSLKNFTVLLAEDYEFMQGLVSSMLRSFGVGNIMVCGSGREAIELLQITQSQARNNAIKPIDMVLVDWMMMDGSGLELIDWVRNNKSDSVRFTPMILVSAFTSEDVVAAARDHGANESLVKPLSGEKLASRILSVIDHPRPFVKTTGFFGPDRRRRLKEVTLERRKIAQEQIITHTEQL
jgi:two-component system, chemotaxis family, chemotaxis protein CheY